MKRRRFIKLFGAGCALAAAGIAGLSSFRASIRNMILDDTRGMNIREEDVDLFLQDAQKEKFFHQYDFTKKGFIVAHTYLMADVLPYQLKYSQYRSQIVGTFLLSTDYFTQKMRADAPVRYTGFYNPYKRPCASPFSNIYYPA